MLLFFYLTYSKIKNGQTRGWKNGKESEEDKCQKYIFFKTNITVKQGEKHRTFGKQR